MSDSSWTHVHQFLELHSRSNSLRSSNLAVGNRAICKMELSSIPNAVKQVDGPTVLSGCNGSPYCWQTEEATAKLRAQSRHSGGPAVM